MGEFRKKLHRVSPMKIILTGYLFIILVGAGLLCLPISVKAGEGLTSFSDAVFTAASKPIRHVGDRLAAQQRVDDALTGQIGAVAHALVGAGGGVRRGYHVFHLQQLAGQGQRLLLEHIQPHALLGHHLEPGAGVHHVPIHPVGVGIFVKAPGGAVLYKSFF